MNTNRKSPSTGSAPQRALLVLAVALMAIPLLPDPVAGAEIPMPNSTPDGASAETLTLPGSGPAPSGPDLPPGATAAWWAALRSPMGEGITGLSPTPNWIATGANDYDSLGCSVASAGDLNGDGYADVIVGAWGYSSSQGAAYVYHGSPSGLGATPALTLTGEAAGDRFGISVASAGDVNGDGYTDAIVGAIGYGSSQGRAYVFHGSPSGLAATPALTLTGETDGDVFGCSVAGAGDVNGDGYADAIVSASGYDGDQGRAYVFHGSPSGLEATPALSATGEADGDRFGGSVASAGDVNGDGYTDVIVGAYGYNSNQGRAYVYHGSTSGLGATAALSLTFPNQDARLGWSVASAGDVNGDGYADVIVGAPGFDGGTDYGVAFLFHGSPSGLEAVPAIGFAGSDQGDNFGCSVASAGDVNGDGYADVIVGAFGYSSGSYQGAAYLFHGSTSGLTVAAPTLTGEYPGDYFGQAVASAGDVNGDGYADVIVGARRYRSFSRQGRAYAYHGAASGLAADSTPTLTGENDGDVFGHSVASAGDINGDGCADVIVGAHGYGSSRGAVYIYHGSPTGLGATSASKRTGENDGDDFGESVASAGDVNGDGYADVIVGADGYEPAGAAYVYHGSPSGLGATPALTLTGENEGDCFGVSVASAGDVNGDGYADVIVGADGYPNEAERGRVYVYHGSPSGLGTTPALTLTGENDGDYFASVTSAGDVNGDGYADVIVGAQGYGSHRGRAYVYHGSPSGLAATPALTLTGENQGNGFSSVASVGDVNGDGYADVIVGARGYGLAQGRAYVYHGSPAGLGATPALTLTGENSWDYFGGSVAGAGDVNGDGYGDAIVGAYGYPSLSLRGQAYVYHGSPSGLGATPAVTLNGENNQDVFGSSVAGAGDVNGDGYADAIVGARGYLGGSLRGRAYVYPGNDGGGRTVLARQLRGDGSGTPVQPWGLSHSGNRFEVQMRATDPMGRGRVKLQVEACPPGTPFGDGACIVHTAATWTDVTTATSGVTLTEIVSGLDRDTLNRWRARVLYAPLHVTEPGITPPPNPAHGPWRRLNGQAVEADLRTLPLWEIFLPLALKSFP